MVWSYDAKTQQQPGKRNSEYKSLRRDINGKMEKKTERCYHRKHERFTFKCKNNQNRRQKGKGYQLDQ